MKLSSRSVPGWLHRMVNGLLGFSGAAAVGAAGYVFFGSGTVLEQLSALLLVLSPILGVLAAVVNPARFSLAEGLAGLHGSDDSEPTTAER